MKTTLDKLSNFFFQKKVRSKSQLTNQNLSERITNSLTKLMVVSSTINVGKLPFQDRLLKGHLSYCALGVVFLVFTRRDDKKCFEGMLICILISE